MNMWKECEALQDDLVRMRRELHQIPEIGKMLPKTQQYVVKELEKLGIPYRCSRTDSSIIAEITGGKLGKTIALRADMDALTIQETNEVDYISTHEGCMHAVTTPTRQCSWGPLKYYVSIRKNYAAMCGFCSRPRRSCQRARRL